MSAVEATTSSLLPDWIAAATPAFRLALLLATSLACNLVLGWLREPTRRLSFAWFFLIHASLPILAPLRRELGFGLGVLPLTVLAAVLGQLAGVRARRRRRVLQPPPSPG